MLRFCLVAEVVEKMEVDLEDLLSAVLNNLQGQWSARPRFAMAYSDQLGGRLLQALVLLVFCAVGSVAGVREGSRAWGSSA